MDSASLDKRWQDRDCLFEPILAMLNAGIGFHRAWLANHGTQLDWRNRMHYDYELVIQEARRLGHPIIITNGKLLTLVPGGAVHGMSHFFIRPTGRDDVLLLVMGRSA